MQPKQRDEGSSGGFRPHCDLGERYGSLTSSGDEVDDPLEIPTDHARMTGHRAESPDAVHERVDSLRGIGDDDVAAVERQGDVWNDGTPVPIPRGGSQTVFRSIGIGSIGREGGRKSPRASPARGLITVAHDAGGAGCAFGKTGTPRCRTIFLLPLRLLVDGHGGVDPSLAATLDFPQRLEKR